MTAERARSTATASADPVALGRAALARGDWLVARTAFEAALDGDGPPEALEGLGWVGWWTSDADLALRSRELAFRGYRAAGEHERAAHVAAWLISDHLEFRGDHAIARGWIGHARRALEGLPEGRGHGWVALHEAYYRFAVDDDMTGAGALADETVRIGRACASTDLEAIGLAQGGLARVAGGDVQEGLRRLDEATALASGAELEIPASIAWALCFMLAACARLGDVPRADQWCAAMLEFAQRWDGRHLIGSCRASYGGVLTTGGSWQSAEQTLTAAVEDLSATRAAMVSSPKVRLGQLRARQGRPDEARALYEEALPSVGAITGLGELALAAGDADVARDAAERALRRLPETAVLDRLGARELLVRAAAAAGDLDLARASQAELDDAAEATGSAFLQARARLAAAELAGSTGEPEVARRCAEDAIDGFGAASAPYDGARSRLALARALLALGRDAQARAEASAARDAFAALGAAADERLAAALLDAVATAPDAPTTPGAPDAELTARELDVLRLVAQGLSDAEVAERLVVSPHTVHRHVANIRAKLRLPSRAAAVAHAAREGLL